jgi:integrase
MATIKLIVKGTKNPSTLYIRFINGRSFDISCSTNLSVDPSQWDSKKSNYKNLSSISDRVKKQAKFEKLKIGILEAYNDSFMMGDIIDKNWLNNAVSSYFNRPKQEKRLSIEKHYVYYSDFALWWIENKAPKWKTDKNKMLSKRVVMQYQSFLKIWKSFEDNNAYKIQDVSNEILDQFTTFMTSKDYASNTTKRQIARAKFFISRAKTEGIKTDPTYQDRVFVEKDQEEIDHPYLNEKEIDSVYNLDLSNDLSLDNIRDNAIIGLWTGLRISDFNKNLDISNIDGDYIRIKTQKTGAWVTIPLHPQVREVIKKRHGNLPVKTSDKHFNEQIKVICMLAEIDQQIKGGVIVVDEKTKEKRKVYGLHKKYKLVSSHICRRSFASNLFGHISNRDLMNICGWAKEDMMLHYIKKTKTESADELKKYWSSKYE